MRTVILIPQMQKGEKTTGRELSLSQSIAGRLRGGGMGGQRGEEDWAGAGTQYRDL